MIRKRVAKRPDWKEKFEEAGFSFHSMDGEYWREGICYEFTSEQIDYLDDVTLEINEMCLAVVDHVVRQGRWDDLAIPEPWRDAVTSSWERRDPSLYGRFDFSYDGNGPAKLLEFNADTPTSLYESSIAQWLWLEETMPRMDQFNSIHEKLLARFQVLFRQHGGEPFHFAAVDEHQEDQVTVEYLRDLAVQSGFTTAFLTIDRIGFDYGQRFFVDGEQRPISGLFKLYPLEWLLADEFGAHLLAGHGPRLYEPMWKLLLSNKGLLPLLWELYPGHDNLLPAYADEPRELVDYVQKPFFSREGANIHVVSAGRLVAENGGSYGEGRQVFQEYRPLPRHGDCYTLIGSWVIGEEPAGLGIREDYSVITKNTSMFVPHYFVPGEDGQ
jgi:glutathionylspermidine synthase